jgi:serine/threonine-protein kinase RsbW
MDIREASLTIPAQLDQIQHASSVVRRLAEEIGFAESDLNQIELAVYEACANIVQHAYAHQTDGHVHISARAEPGRRIVITLLDTGTTFDPKTIPAYDPQQVTEGDGQVGGLGLFLIRRMMDEVHFEFCVPGSELGLPGCFNRLTLIKNL